MRPRDAVRRAGLLLMAMAAAACGSLDQARDAFCAQRSDVCDASVPVDAGASDGGAADAGTPDAGAPDSGAPDAGASDAGLVCPYVTGAGTGTVSGTVTSVHSGSPLTAASVWWGSTEGATCNAGVNCVTTDASGSYMLTQVTAGCVIVSGKSNGYLLRTFDVVVDAGASIPLDVALSTSGILSGTVRWADGSTVSGALVRADGGELYTEASMTANGSGHYMSSFIAIGHYTVTASAPDGGLPQTQGVTLTTSGNTLDFMLDGGP